jgi:hypothetical protein
MSLLSECLALAQDWRSVFPQQRTVQRAVRQALGSLICLGRRCLARMIWTDGGQDRSWSAEYFLHSRCRWEPQQLFPPILQRAWQSCPQRLAGGAGEDTLMPHTFPAIGHGVGERSAEQVKADGWWRVPELGSPLAPVSLEQNPT